MSDTTIQTEENKDSSTTIQSTDTTTTNATATETTTEAATTETTATETAAASPDPVIITDDMFYQELTKRYPEKIKAKEDLERVLSFNESEYIKPHDELITKLNEWRAQGKDPKEYLELAELDTDKMDSKESVIRYTMMKRGVSREDAALIFESKYSKAYSTSEDENYDEKVKRLAELDLAEEARNAKAELSKYKVTALTPAKIGPTEEEIQAQRKFKQETWDQPVENAIKGLSKIETNVKFQLPDEQEVADIFQYGADKEETKAIIKDMLSDPSKMIEKFMNRYGSGKTPEEGFMNLARKLYELEHLDDIKAGIAAFGASKGVAAHLAKVRPGNLAETSTTAAEAPVTREEAILAAMKDKLSRKR